MQITQVHMRVYTSAYTNVRICVCDVIFCRVLHERTKIEHAPTYSLFKLTCIYFDE